MSAAVLTILGDATGVKRALGETVTDARRASSAISAESRRAAAERRRADAEEVTFARRQLRVQYEARARDLRDRLRAEKAASAERRRFTQSEAAEAAKAEKEKTAGAAKESNARTRIARQEATAAERAEKKKTADAAREDKRRTRLAETEAKNRARAVARAEREETARIRQAVGWGRRAAGAVLGGAADFAGNMDGQIQGARQERAGIEHTLNSAFFQAGNTSPAQARQWRQRITARARDLGQDPQEVAGALLSAQSQFNVLAPEGNETREQAIDRNMSVVEMAANSYQSPQELLRLSGVLGQQGIRGADRRSVLMSLTGMGQAGGVELSNLSSEALGPLMQNIARGTNAGMTPEARSAAVRDIVAETVGISEVASRGGLSALDSTRAAGKFRGDLTSGASAERYYARLHAAGRDDVARSILTTDRRGRHTFQAGLDPTELMTRIQTGFGGNSAAAMNALRAGGGPGRAAMDAQQLRLFEILAGQTAPGGTIKTAVGAVRAHGADFNDARLAEGEALRKSEDQTTLTQNHADNVAALRDLHPDLVGVSDSINNWKMRHPWLAEGGNQGAGVVQKAGDIALDVAKADVGRRVVQRVLPTAARRTLGTAAEGAGNLLRRGARAVGRWGSGAIGLLSDVLHPGNEDMRGHTTYFDDAAARRAHRTGGVAAGTAAGTRDDLTRSSALALQRDPSAALTAAVNGLTAATRELQSRPLVATISPHDAGVAGAGNNGSRNMPPTP